MTEELENKLYAKYPKIFVNKDKSMMETCMCWGIECGDGWYWLLDNLCGSIQWRIDNPPWINGIREVIPQVTTNQIKEKFGTLRFYYSGGNDDISSMVSFAEALSGGICEICGTTKHVGCTKGWLITICKDCIDKRKDKMEWEEND